MNKRIKLVLPSVGLLVIFLCLFCCVSPVFGVNQNGVRYSDITLSSASTNELIYYTSKTVLAKNQTQNYVPKYQPIGSLTNSCGAIAGAMMVSFYDKYFENLIPGYTSYYPQNGNYKIADKIVIPNLINQLYTLMRTNVDDVGVSQSDFQNGLKSYIQQRGYAASYTSIISGGNINYQQYVNAIDANKPIILFSNPCDIYVLGYSDGYDKLTNISITSGHIMIGCGYYQIRYDNNGTVTTETLLLVATGKPTPSLAYLRLNEAQVNEASILNVA